MLIWKEAGLQNCWIWRPPGLGRLGFEKAEEGDRKEAYQRAPCLCIAIAGLGQLGFEEEEEGDRKEAYQRAPCLCIAIVLLPSSIISLYLSVTRDSMNSVTVTP